ncbi:TIGR00730 family Rossman fold protein [archaeon]|nr:MAG: TIGR00730 family Rossman fold protein [archaeon]
MAFEGGNFESNKVFRVCVFGSSAPSTKTLYYDESVRLGRLIAERGCLCVNGAGRYGVMGGVNEGCLSSSGRIKGVIHKTFLVDNGEDSRLKDLVVTEGNDLSERKNMLFANADCVICMPGGVGTFDEFWDGVCARSLNMKGLGATPFCLVNIDGFYDGFIQQTKRAKQDGMMYLELDEYYHVSSTIEDALDWCVSKLSDQSYTSSPVHSTRISTRTAEAPEDQKLPQVSDSVKRALLAEDGPEEMGGTGSYSLDFGNLAIAGLCLATGYAVGYWARK